MLVNNVGMAGGAGLVETTDAQWQEALDHTLFPAIRMSRAVVPSMVSRGGGAIIMIASIYGREAGGRMTYNAVKAAEISLAKSLAQQVDRRKASKTPTFNVNGDGMNTTHYSVVDSKGNAVATTTTLNNSYGSGVWVRGGGFLLNDEMDDFAAKPGAPNMFGLVQGEANAIKPGKRMLSAMAPTIVLDPQGEVLLVTGAAGGPTIITATMEVILNVIEHHMSLADAMRAPRLHHQALPDTIRYERNGLSGAVVDSLTAMGHSLQASTGIANVNSIMRVKGGWHGVFEPRSVGGAVGY